MSGNFFLSLSATCAAVVWTTFVVWYWLRAKWWKISVGRNTMSLAILLALVFDRIAFYLWFGVPSGATLNQQISGMVIYTAATVIGVQKIYLMEQSQRRPVAHNRRKDDPKD